jgi:GH43 family beta-xylosidase
MGMVWAEFDSDLLDAGSWSKAQKPVFATSAHNGQYGPGHNSFTVGEDGESDVLVYHARPYPHIYRRPADRSQQALPHAGVYLGGRRFRFSEFLFPTRNKI